MIFWVKFNIKNVKLSLKCLILALFGPKMTIFKWFCEKKNDVEKWKEINSFFFAKLVKMARVGSRDRHT